MQSTTRQRLERYNMKTNHFLADRKFSLFVHLCEYSEWVISCLMSPHHKYAIRRGSYRQACFMARFMKWSISFLVVLERSDLYPTSRKCRLSAEPKAEFRKLHYEYCLLMADREVSLCHRLSVSRASFPLWICNAVYWMKITESIVFTFGTVDGWSVSYSEQQYRLAWTVIRKSVFRKLHNWMRY